MPGKKGKGRNSNVRRLRNIQLIDRTGDSEEEAGNGLGKIIRLFSRGKGIQIFFCRKWETTKACKLICFKDNDSDVLPRVSRGQQT